MLRELECIARWGRPGDLEDYHAAEHLAFWARDKVISALIKRGLIDDAENATDAGRAALAAAQATRA